MKKLVTEILFCCICTTLASQNVLKGKDWTLNLSGEGHIEYICFHQKTGNDTLSFFGKDKKAGPSFYYKLSGKETITSWTPNGRYSYKSESDGMECVINYKRNREWPAIEVVLTNRGHVPFQPQTAGLKIGINTYMDAYPAWMNKYFPTLMRNERTHFYGYLQSPEENTVAIVCEQPVASWSVDYNLGYQDPAPHWFMGHRIESLNIDLLHQLPLPDRHPQRLYQLQQGESKTWLFTLVNVGKLEKLETTLAQVADIPLFHIGQTSCRPGEEIRFEVYAQHPELTCINDQGIQIPVETRSVRKGMAEVTARLPEVGLYTVRMKDGNKEAEAILTAHHTWQWTLEKAREAALVYHQKASSHAESYYGFYSAFLARRYFHRPELDRKLEERFDLLLSKMYDLEAMKPRYIPSRIQNTSTIIGELTDKYEAGKQINDLKTAAALADWLIANNQREDGAYFNHGTVYTSVIYIAKSLMELCLVEKELGKQDSFWQTAYERHYQSVKRAIDQLVRSQGDFQTEGELTFEDGMISCSALQIGMFALLQEDPEACSHYTQEMLKILNSHNCLTQLRVPDARRRQGTMRFWEAQYDVQMLPNMFNSPHGWSAWRSYATYYAYLLTGDEVWLQQIFNAMGAFSNLIDYRTGQLRWAFVLDPFLEVEQACSADTHYTFDDVSLGNPHPRLYETRRFIIGEQYVNMISDWQPINTQDNDVHELFKCMGETVLTQAFIVEQPDGTVRGYNCDVRVKGKELVVTPQEKQIVQLHANLKKAYKVAFRGKEKDIPGDFLGWVTD